jgi:hypothetical protein
VIAWAWGGGLTPFYGVAMYDGYWFLIGFLGAAWILFVQRSDD